MTKAEQCMISRTRVGRYGRPPLSTAEWWRQIKEISLEMGVEPRWHEWSSLPIWQQTPEPTAYDAPPKATGARQAPKASPEYSTPPDWDAMPESEDFGA